MAAWTLNVCCIAACMSVLDPHRSLSGALFVLLTRTCSRLSCVGFRFMVKDGTRVSASFKICALHLMLVTIIKGATISSSRSSIYVPQRSAQLRARRLIGAKPLAHQWSGSTHPQSLNCFLHACALHSSCRRITQASIILLNNVSAHLLIEPKVSHTRA